MDCFLIAPHTALDAEPDIAHDMSERPKIIVGFDLVEQQAAHAALLGFIEPILLEALNGKEGALVGDVIAQVGQIDAPGGRLNDEGVAKSGLKLGAGEDKSGVRKGRTCGPANDPRGKIPVAPR